MKKYTILSMHCFTTGNSFMKPKLSLFLFFVKWSDKYSVVLHWLQCCLGSSLLWSALQYIQSVHLSISAYTRASPLMNLVLVESHFSECVVQHLDFSCSCPACAIFVLGVVGKDSPSSPRKKIFTRVYFAITSNH